MENQEVIIRDAEVADAVEITNFLQPFFENRTLLRRSPEEVKDLTKHGFVAEQAGTCVGFAAIEIYSRKLAEVLCLAVDPSHHNKGIGRKLVSQCTDRARDLGVMEVMAISSSDEFLQTCGFNYILPDQKKALFIQLRSRE